jgi:ribosomal-protein-alanine N-acetyltransferase
MESASQRRRRRYFYFPFDQIGGSGMDAQMYFLKSARLGFRCWTREDFPLAQQLWGDPEVTRYFGGPFSEQVVLQKLEQEISRKSVHGFQYWPIHLLSDDEHVGCCGLRPYHSEEAVHELGFHLRPKYWGQGLAREAAKAVIDFAFETIHPTGLAAGHHPGNVNSKKVLEKLGFTYTHDEYYRPLQISIPYYFLPRPQVSGDKR